VVSIDIIDVEKPPFVDEFYQMNVEKPIRLKQKFDVVVAFEVIEHLDNTDMLLVNAYNNLKKEGIFIISFPNLSSWLCRLELLLGYQPHILEISNKKACFGQGFLGRINNPANIPIHHIRGITTKAMKEMLEYYGFKIRKVCGYDWQFPKIFRFLPKLASVNIFISEKKGVK